MIEIDVCDQCGVAVRAYVWAETAEGRELTWCGHCATIHETALRGQGGRFILDLRYLIGG